MYTMRQQPHRPPESAVRTRVVTLGLEPTRSSVVSFPLADMPSRLADASYPWACFSGGFCKEIRDPGMSQVEILQRRLPETKWRGLDVISKDMSVGANPRRWSGSPIPAHLLQGLYITFTSCSLAVVMLP